MSTMIYNGVKLFPWRTLSVDIEPIYTEDRADVLYHRYTIEGTAVVNPVATVGGNIQLVGDPIRAAQNALQQQATAQNMDLNLNQLRRQLLEPRQTLTFTLSDQQDSFFIRSPALDQAGNPLRTDCDNGPHPEYCRILQVWGTQSALVAYRITTTVSNCSKIILSNRWTVSHSVDGNGFTTRTQKGKAFLRSDLAWWNNGAAWILDQFRQLFFLPAPASFRRMNVDVHQSSDGLSYEYTVTDREVRYGTGGNGGITRIDGHVTSGYAYPMKNVMGAAGAIKDTVVDMASLPFQAVLNPLGFMGDAWNAGAAALGRLATANANATVRVYGQRGADLTTMANVAIQVAIDRLTPQAVLWFQTPIFYSAYLTQSLDSDGAPFVQLTASALTGLYNAIQQGAFGIVDLPKGQNMSANINMANGTMMSRDNPVVQQLPASSGTRGSYLGSLFSQALISGCNHPDAPVVDASVQDASELI